MGWAEVWCVRCLGARVHLLACAASSALVCAISSVYVTYRFTSVHALSRVLLGVSEQQASDEFLRKFYPLPALLNLMSNALDLTEVRECRRAKRSRRGTLAMLCCRWRHASEQPEARKDTDEQPAGVSAEVSGGSTHQATWCVQTRARVMHGPDRGGARPQREGEREGEKRKREEERGREREKGRERERKGEKGREEEREREGRERAERTRGRQTFARPRFDFGGTGENSTVRRTA